MMRRFFDAVHLNSVRTMKFLLLSAVLLTFVYGQPPPQQQRCMETPAQWIGVLHEHNFEANGGREPEIRHNYFYYDATNERVNITEYEIFEPSGRSELIQELYFFRDETMYRIEGRRCEKQSLNETFHPYGLREARFFGREILGAVNPGLGVLVDGFHDERDGGFYHGFWAPIRTTSDRECIPVLEDYVRLEGPVPRRVNAHFTFLNVSVVTTASPFPPSTFTIPPECIPPPRKN